MIYDLKKSATPTQISDMLTEYESMIKIVVDIRRRILAGAVKCTQTANQFCWMLDVSVNKTQRTLLSVQAKQWSDKALEISGL